MSVTHLTRTELDAGLESIRSAPRDAGELLMIVRRPAIGEREILDVGHLDVVDGLLGDTWKSRPSSRMPNGVPHPDMQINIMNSRVTALVAQDKSRWSLAGDQLYIDMDLSKENLPGGTQLAIGTAVLEVSPLPHTGCHKFVARFGLEAMKFVNSPVGKELCLRGINARVIKGGVIRVGDTARKL